MPNPIDPQVSSLPREALDELLAEIAIFPTTSQQRGRHYAATGRVISVDLEPPFLHAQVRGTRSYQVQWERTLGGWSPSCDCPVGVDCKHAYAAAAWVLAQARATTGYTHARLTRLVPREIGSTGAAPRIAPPPEPPVPGKRAAGFGPVRTPADHWDRQERFGRLLQANPDIHVDEIAGEFSQLLREPDPEILCWKLAHELPRFTYGWLPRELEPYRDRPDLAARHAARLRGRLADQLTEWSRRRRPRGDRSLRVTLGLETTGEGGLSLRFDARLSGPRMRDEPKTLWQLQQFRSQERRSPGLLPPEQAALIELLTDGETLIETERGPELTGSGLVRLVQHFAGERFVTWDPGADPALAARVGVAPGEPIRFEHQPARLLPSAAIEAGAARIELSFFWPDGRSQPLRDTVFLPRRVNTLDAHPALVLAHGAFSMVTEQPPGELVELFRAAGGLPVTRSDAETVLPTLAASFPTLRAGIAPLTRVHAVRPTFAMDLADDWLRFRLFARPEGSEWRPGDPIAPDLRVFELTPNRRWTPLDPEPARGGRKGTARGAAGRDAGVDRESSGYARLEEESGTGDGADAPAEEAPMPAAADPIATPAAEVLLELPDPARVDPMVAWLETTGARPADAFEGNRHQPVAADAEHGFWLRLTARTSGALADAWDARPADCDWFGTPAVRRLLVMPDRLRPRLRVESSGVDWFAVSAEWESEGLTLSDADLARLRESTSRFVKIGQGWVRRETAALQESTAEVLADLGLEVGAGPQRVTVWQLAQASPESIEAVERLAGGSEAAAALRRLRDQVATFSGLPHVDPPPGFQGTLRPYQQEGLDFLAYTASLGLGVILADDMGLGKTVQALAWLEGLREREPRGGPVLVLCPASVVHNWQREAQRFVPGMRVLLLERGQQRHSLRAAIPDHDLIVTNYALLRRDLEDWKTVDLRAVVLDEAQFIKNPDAEISRAVRELRTRHRLALTGTPLENRALDLWSIMAFLNPGYLGTRNDFAARYDRLDTPPFARTLLAAKLRPVLLRRLKQQVARDLPPRIEEVRDCEMTQGQHHLYVAELAHIRSEIARMSASDAEMKKNRFEILAALTRLRQLCCHPALVGGKLEVGSGKFEAVFELLEPLLAEGHKVLLFSQFVRCLELLEAEMKRRGIAHHLLTGSTIRREQVVAGFTEDSRPAVFLVSLKAGGTGLNLTAASYVILFDPWWNPAVEAQAIDRTHRIGQKRTVIAYRMLTQGTVEERIWELQQKKSAMAKHILGEEGFARALTRDDLRYLLAEE